MAKEFTVVSYALLLILYSTTKQQNLDLIVGPASSTQIHGHPDLT